MRKKLDIMNFYKGFSIFTIIIMHLIQIFISKEISVHPIIFIGSSFGGAGVHVFILCSGFGLYYSQQKRQLRFLDFIKKRLSKIYLPYIPIVVISSFIPGLYNYNDKFLAILSHIFLFKGFSARWIDSFGVQFWFITTIIELYLVFIPFLNLKKLFKNSKNFFLFACLLSICYWIFLFSIGKSDSRVWTSFFLNYLWVFILGMILAEQYLNTGSIFLDKLKIINLSVIFIISFALYSFFSFYGAFLKSFNDFFSMISYLTFSTIIYRLSINKLNAFFIKISTISYDIYLWHIFIFFIIFNYTQFDLVIKSMLSLLLTYLIAYFYRKTFNLYYIKNLNKINNEL
ncbi:acyltransferase family protein [Enterococcus casseliflavus]|uniref:acyltransferase family protein n=1 Tax=Enterococcus casseliflavus TaxID=37734 RepID=UPI003D0F072D